MTILQYLDNLQIKNTNCNTVSCSKLLVTIFAAPYLDSLVNAYKSQPSNTFHHRNAIPKPAAPYFANIAPYPSRYRDKFLAEETGRWPESCAG